MIVGSILTFARVQVQTDSNGLNDTNGLAFANEALQDYHRRLVKAGVDAAQVVEASITGTVNVGTYAYPTAPASIAALKTIELNYASTSTNDYVTAAQVDVSNLPEGVSFSWLRGNASPQAPMFDDRGNTFEIFPTPTSAHNVTNIARLFYYAQPSVFTAASDTVNYPENLDPAILGWRTAANYLYSLGTSRIPDGDKFNAKYEERVKDYINSLGRGSKQPLQSTTIQIDGFEF